MIIRKPWGKEVILTGSSSPYTIKLEYINSKNRLSLQYHDSKTETLILISGKAKIITGPDANNLTVQPMKPYQAFHIVPQTVHRIEAENDCLVLEVSTSEKGTTFRLEDDYLRGNETPEIRNSPNRGWQNDR